ncbi:EmrB/QacA subfamily drug resistance transporter [Haloactinopolyspora alba]|uniref:EmrB/QacA subfamily drug resistance transporter n=1 Tax=Haloactinopolyspora alba TaxID=648780 RepID=A0A2P8E2C2_9ACTN|nr:MFS transporter [Haloactinopolyspora alba]PSL03609.1 EmrB/QacA subfamily drug resistance transporter [Haloactinopolyspora alba]
MRIDNGGIRTPPRRTWTLLLASLGAFLASLDVVVVATALPVLRADLGADLADLEWTLNAYNLAFACLILTGAALGDRFGRRRTYVTGVGVFVAASGAAALSSSAGELIAARVFQGAGAALVLPLTLTLISDIFPAAKRAAAIGIWGGVSGLGVAIGPVLGGAITEGISWQWIFWINVPVGVVVMVLSAALLRESHGPRPQLDIRGMLSAASGLFLLTWAAVRAPEIGWGSAEVVTALVAGSVVMVGFVQWEQRATFPMLPLGYLRRRGFAGGNGVIFFQFLSLVGALFMIAQLFQTGLGYSPLDAGLRILVWTAMPMVGAPIAGLLSGRFGTRPLMLLGLVLQSAGLAWVALVAEVGMGYPTLVPPLVVAGVGISMIFGTSATTAVAAVPLEDSGVAAGTNSALREVGAVFGVAIVGAVFAANGSYASASSFLDGFVPAVWTAAGLAALGIVVAFVVPGRSVDAAEAAAAPGDDAVGARV